MAAYGALGGLALADPNCTCRNGGEFYRVGQLACIRGQLARCEMFLNNTSWRIIAETCPVSQASSSPLALLSPKAQ
jgi:hypothetical protein